MMRKKIKNSRGERQHQLRKDWMTHEKFVTMYDRVYAAMVDAKIANPMEKPDYYFINRYGIQVKTEEETEGHRIKHCLSHPQCVLFGYEVGTDTNQIDYGNNGGQRYIIMKGIITNLLSYKASGSFKLMGLTDATGEPVLCI